MNPTPGDVHVNRVLTQISIAYVLRESVFVAPRVFPNIPVTQQTNLYRTYERGDWFRVEAGKRAPATESRGGGWRVGTASYQAFVYAIHQDIDDQTRANADADIDLDTGATRYVTQQLMLLREQIWAATYFAAGIWGTNLTGVAAAPGANQFLQWNDAASDPIMDIQRQALIMERSTGFRPNRLVISPEVELQLLNHPDIIDRIKYTQRGQASLDLLSALFNVEEVLVPHAIVNSGPEGGADSFGFIYGKGALLVYAAPNPSLMEPSGGYSFSWTGYVGAGPMGNRVKRFRLEQIASDRVEGEMAFDMKLVAPEVGVFFASAVA